MSFLSVNQYGKKIIFNITIIASILMVSRLISGCSLDAALKEETNSNDIDMEMNISETNGEDSSA